jgi:hypothetical protein
MQVLERKLLLNAPSVVVQSTYWQLRDRTPGDIAHNDKQDKGRTYASITTEGRESMLFSNI